MMRLVVSIDHMGRTGRRAGDKGAAHGSLHEVDLTWRIAESIYQTGRERHDIILATHGSYSERHAWANKHGADVYLAMHINASGSERADYGAFFYHPATKTGNGDRLAELMAAEVTSLAHRRNYKTFKARAIAAAGDTWRNARYTIGGLARPVGVCCEPFFISSPENRAAFCTTDALLALGRAYLAGIERWHTSK